MRPKVFNFLGAYFYVKKKRSNKYRLTIQKSKKEKVLFYEVPFSIYKKLPITSSAVFPNLNSLNLSATDMAVYLAIEKHLTVNLLSIS